MLLARVAKDIAARRRRQSENLFGGTHMRGDGGLRLALEPATPVSYWSLRRKMPCPTPAGSSLRADWKATHFPSGLTTGFEAL
jgi:hypothetical protein